MTLEQQFESHILQQHQIAKDETGYKAPLFKRMVTERGALQTAKDLLVGPNKISEGLTRLVLHNRLDLSLEANVIKPEWRSLFSDEELKSAAKRLKELKYPIDETYEDYIHKKVTTEVSVLPQLESYNNEVTNSDSQTHPTLTNQNKGGIGDHLLPERKSYETNKIIRDQGLPKQVKEMYEYKCQICEMRLEVGNYWYAEAAHIRALGNPHNGKDALNNILCLCPNHHKLFDIGGFYIEDDLTIPILNKKLYRHKNHSLDFDAIRYHRAWCVDMPEVL